MSETVSDIDDPRLAPYRNLKEARLAARDGLFIAEGRAVVRMLLQSPFYRAASILVTPPALESLRDVLQKPSEGLDGRVPKVLIASKRLLEAVAGFDVHRGCLAAAARGTPRTIEEALFHIAEGPALVVVLEGVNNHDNIGGVFRNAAALGASAVLLGPGCVDPLYRKAIRVSMGTVLRLPWGEIGEGTIGECLKVVRRSGFALAALTPDPEAHDIHDLTPAAIRGQRIGLLLGAEGTGLTDEALAAADIRVKIPMSAGVDSLNIAAASAIALHHFRPRSVE